MVVLTSSKFLERYPGDGLRAVQISQCWWQLLQFSAMSRLAVINDSYASCLVAYQSSESAACVKYKRKKKHIYLLIVLVVSRVAQKPID
jgi:hypothetical protein